MGRKGEDEFCEILARTAFEPGRIGDSQALVKKWLFRIRAVRRFREVAGGFRFHRKMRTVILRFLRHAAQRRRLFLAHAVDAWERAEAAMLTRHAEKKRHLRGRPRQPDLAKLNQSDSSCGLSSSLMSPSLASHHGTPVRDPDGGIPPNSAGSRKPALLTPLLQPSDGGDSDSDEHPHSAVSMDTSRASVNLSADSPGGLRQHSAPNFAQTMSHDNQKLTATYTQLPAAPAAGLEAAVTAPLRPAGPVSAARSLANWTPSTTRFETKLVVLKKQYASRKAAAVRRWRAAHAACRSAHLRMSPRGGNTGRDSLLLVADETPSSTTAASANPGNKFVVPMLTDADVEKIVGVKWDDQHDRSRGRKERKLATQSVLDESSRFKVLVALQSQLVGTQDPDAAAQAEGALLKKVPKKLLESDPEGLDNLHKQLCEDATAAYQHRTGRFVARTNPKSQLASRLNATGSDHSSLHSSSNNNNNRAAAHAAAQPPSQGPRLQRQSNETRLFGGSAKAPQLADIRSATPKAAAAAKRGAGAPSDTANPHRKSCGDGFGHAAAAEGGSGSSRKAGGSALGYLPPTSPAASRSPASSPRKAHQPAAAAAAATGGGAARKQAKPGPAVLPLQRQASSSSSAASSNASSRSGRREPPGLVVCRPVSPRASSSPLSPDEAYAAERVQKGASPPPVHPISPAQGSSLAVMKLLHQQKPPADDPSPGQGSGACSAAQRRPSLVADLLLPGAPSRRRGPRHRWRRSSRRFPRD
ncbi:hypothetical protein DIPPA_16115 [Diplonema papillatum]|nr:hypothetical protein DIPPA_16115 [Diplonema papillatum]